MPKISDKTLTIRLPKEIYDLVSNYASEEHRSLNSAITHLLSLALNKQRVALYKSPFPEDTMQMPTPEEFQRCLQAYNDWFTKIFANRGSFGAQNKTKFEEYCFAVTQARPESMTLYQWKVLENTIVCRIEALGGIDNFATEIDAIYRGAKPAMPIVPEPQEPRKPELRTQLPATEQTSLKAAAIKLPDPPPGHP